MPEEKPASANDETLVSRTIKDVDEAIRKLQSVRAALEVSALSADSTRGCTWDKRNQLWKARAWVNGSLSNLGSYKTLDEARTAYISAKKTDKKI